MKSRLHFDTMKTVPNSREADNSVIEVAVEGQPLLPQVFHEHVTVLLHYYC